MVDPEMVKTEVNARRANASDSTFEQDNCPAQEYDPVSEMQMDWRSPSRQADV
jgi:hypothetical protein